MKGDSIVMHPILSKASLREPDTERLNTMLRVALTPLQYETVVAVYLARPPAEGGRHRPGCQPGKRVPAAAAGRAPRGTVSGVLIIIK